MNVFGGGVFSLPILIEQSLAKQYLSGFELLSNQRKIGFNVWWAGGVFSFPILNVQSEAEEVFFRR